MGALYSFWKKSNYGVKTAIAFSLIFFTIAIFCDLISPHNPNEIFQESFKLSPSFEATKAGNYFLLGTDDVGRDLLSRLLKGARVSLTIGFGVVLFSSLLGTILGMLAGFYEKKVDFFIMRFTDMLMALPSILLAIVVVALLGPGLENTIFAVSIVSVPAFVRLMRASVLEEKSKEYVQASVANGASPVRVLFKEIFPNTLSPLIVQSSLGFSEAVLSAAALGFLGLGVQAPTPEWGTMLADSRGYIESSPWLVTIPGLCILTIVLTFNILGDGLRDFLDPRMKGR